MAFTENGITITNYFAKISDYAAWLPLGGAQGIGLNTYGQLGTINTTTYSSPITIPNYNWIDVALSKKEVTAGVPTLYAIDGNGFPIGTDVANYSNNFTCSYSSMFNIKSDGTLWAWGSKDAGQLGLRDLIDRYSPIQVGTLSNWSQAEGGFFHSAAIKTDGTLWTWGQNNLGQLGISSTIQKNSPTQTYIAAFNFKNILPNYSTKTNPININWNTFACGYKHTIGLKTDGTLWGWGNNNFGQLGIGDVAVRNSPIQVGTSSDWSKVAGGAYHVLALKTNGTLWACGYNGLGSLALGDRTNRSSMVQIGTLSDWSKISTSVNHHVVAIKSDGTLWGWGRNSEGQLGLSDLTNRSSPVQVGTLSNWSQLACNPLYSLATKTDGTLWAWGSNAYGQLGQSNITNRSSPVQVGALSNWSKVSGNRFYAAAIKTDGTLWSWGLNSWGQLGLYVPATQYTNLVQKTTTNDYTSVSTNKNTTFFTKNDGSVWSLGNNSFGVLGSSNVTNRSIPVQIGSINRAVKVDVKNYSAIILFK